MHQTLWGSGMEANKVIANNKVFATTKEYLRTASESLLFVTARPPVVMASGRGMHLMDTEGKEYLDFVGGWAVTCLGHSPEVIHKALFKQSQLLVNASPAFLNEPMIELADLLTKVSGFERVFFASTGAEANESAIKLARKYGAKHLDGAYEIITMIKGFHGRTITTMSATGKEQWNALFEPKTPGFIHVRWNDREALEMMVSEKTCAVMLEPIQGEGGVNIASTEYLNWLSDYCAKKKILLIFDEIQTGIGRTGKLFGFEHTGIRPDIMTLAKGLGGGFPVSAMLARERLNIFDPGDQGGTFCGQPLAMAVALAVVHEVIEKDLAGNADRMGQYLAKKLEELVASTGIHNIRGQGLLAAFDHPKPLGTEVVDACRELGLLVNSPQPLTIRLIPPLIVEKKHIDTAIGILERVLLLTHY
jgi:acetylornithine/N-succinyldiaminopimelate aminotransferase